MRRIACIAVSIGLATAYACGGGGTGGPDAKVFKDAPGSGGSNMFTLTVKNYLSWCSVTVGTGAGSSASSQSVSVMPSAVTLTAKGIAGFMLGSQMWHLVDGDTGAGIPGTVSGSTSTATATVSTANKCVWVCCPSSTTTTDCDGVANQCP